MSSEVASAPKFILKGVERHWGDRVALDGVDLTIEPGERLALIGPSGSGKTTLLKLLNASLSPTKGVVEVDGSSVTEMQPNEIRSHRLRCGLVDQGVQLIPRSTVHSNVIAGSVPTWPWWRTIWSVLWPVDKERVQGLLADVGLADRQWDRVNELSGGQRQRISIARALAGKQTMLLADEPTAALDPTTSREVMDLLSRETERRKATLVVSTHRVSQVMDSVDRVIGLRGGKILFDQPPKETDEALLKKLYAGSREML